MLRRKSPRAFTLIELLLVLVILAVLAGVAVPIYMGQAKEAKVKATRTSIGMIKQALATYEVQQESFPTTDQGLDALVHQPEGASDWHPYLDKLPLDAWNQPFVYHCPASNGTGFYDLYSIGPDGQEGTADDIVDTQ